MTNESNIVLNQIQQDAQQLLPHIATHNDFPKPGIVFRDFLPILQDAKAFELLIDLFERYIRAQYTQIDAVFGLEARGFLIGPLLAQRLHVPFLPIRKAGKLPGPVDRYTYQLEYGSDTIEVQKNQLPSKSKCILIDDLLATGGTLKASMHLLKQNGFEVLDSLVIIELIELNGRRHLEAGGNHVFSLIQF